MSTQTVTVLTPHGRRQNVKVTPNMTVLEVLEEVCKKYNFSSDEYDLKHHKRTIDLTTMFRFSGLPNNAQLEMIEAKNVRKEEDVVLCLQLENGSRFQETFKPSIYLHDVILKLTPDNIAEDTVIIYMRKEIFGEALKTTSLKTLGLTSGRAAIRLVHRNPDELKTQANVSAPLPIKPVVESEKPENKKDVPKNELKNEETPSTSNVTGSKPNENQTDDELKIDSNSVGYTLNRDYSVSPELQNEPKKLKIDQAADNVKDVEMIVEPEIIELGERNAILFSLDSVRTDDLNDLPDSFFELTVNDMKKILRDLKTQRAEMDDAPLLTAKMRELEESKKVLNQLAVYKKTVIRIQFQDRLVLQGTFTPVENVEHVREFVRKYLRNDQIDFHLFTTPPKHILDTNVSLIESQCVPQALLHFGVDDSKMGPTENDSFIKEEFITKLTSPLAAGLAASKCRGFNKNIASDSLENDYEPCSSGAGEQSLAGPSSKPKDENFITSSSVKETNLPKWFKPIGK